MLTRIKRVPMSTKIQKIIKNQQESYQNVFLKHRATCHQPTFHYDWWMFPQKVPAAIKVSAKSRSFAISDEDTKALLKHKQFTATYLRSIDKYLSNLEQYGWNDYDIRYAKMLHSLHQFLSVATLMKHDVDAKIQSKLQSLAQRATRFAEKNINMPSSLLKRGAIKLNKLIENQPLPQLSAKKNELIIAITAMLAVVAAFSLFSMPLYFLPLAFTGLLATKIAYENMRKSEKKCCLENKSKELPPKRIDAVKRDKRSANDASHPQKKKDKEYSLDDVQPENGIKSRLRKRG